MTTTTHEPVTLPRALWRGLTMRCPNCGQASLFGRFLKVVDDCPACGEEFSPYLVILVLGHLAVPIALAIEVAFAPPMWLQYLIWIPFVAIGAITLLQPTKGAVVALQWHMGMHGFEAAKKRRDLATGVDHSRLAEIAG
jgi:uncharacterized protein (DUF983 family)